MKGGCPLPSFSISLRGGRPIKGDDLRAAVEEACDPIIRKAGLAMEAAIKRATPVRTGNLRRSWTTAQEPQWAGNIRRVPVGTAVVYARHVQYVGRSAGYIDRGLQAGVQPAKRQLEMGVEELAHHLWVKEK